MFRTPPPMYPGPVLAYDLCRSPCRSPHHSSCRWRSGYLFGYSTDDGVLHPRPMASFSDVVAARESQAECADAMQAVQNGSSMIRVAILHNLDLCHRHSLGDCCGSKCGDATLLVPKKILHN